MQIKPIQYGAKQAVTADVIMREKLADSDVYSFKIELKDSSTNLLDTLTPDVLPFNNGNINKSDYVSLGETREERIRAVLTKISVPIIEQDPPTLP